MQDGIGVVDHLLVMPVSPAPLVGTVGVARSCSGESIVWAGCPSGKV